MRAGVQDQAEPARGRWRDDWPVAAVAAVAAALVWAVARVAGVEIEVGSGSDAQEVGPVSVVVTALVLAVVGAALLRLLERRTPRALGVWTAIALAVCAVSLAAPAGAETPAAGLTLAVMHVAVGAVVILGLRRRRAGRVA
ncbi:DUF6069 family protein [Nocardioides sp. cx-173]|uniref:DUF6069 family protein n=1 Tax=Nocardioides sp. cx-173 TaxID=2898796 RepID=UPI001E38FB4C|nr:DUF6069 family protein [Nocardioides sp. cx-173]MCD4524341.1 DUF6069 family protein [Nocardioides sp. cx-173]UGB41729.1 DUF6069 family protein [Nocardioides sp. cx-173]